MRSYDEFKNLSKSKMFSNLNESAKKSNLALASQSATNFYNVSKNKIKNKYVEEINEKIDYTNKNYAKEFLIKKKPLSRLENYDKIILPPTANDKKLFSSSTSFNSFK